MRLEYKLLNLMRNVHLSLMERVYSRDQHVDGSIKL